MSDEVVAVIKTNIADTICRDTINSVYVWRWLLSEAGYMSRHLAEGNPDYQQLITYNVVMYGDLVLSYGRGTVESDPRLANKISVGVGGHMRQFEDTQICIRRELLEEAPGLFPPEANGTTNLVIAPQFVLNENETDVGKEHIGLASVVYTHTQEPTGEGYGYEIENPQWRDLCTSCWDTTDLEDWSRITVNELLRRKNNEKSITD